MDKRIKYYLVITLLSVVLLPESAFAQEGANIFKDAACNLLGAVLTEYFGAMLTVLAGTLAIISSVTGSFRMAWVLLFVSVGIFIFPELVETFFPLNCPKSGGGA
jgi:hypothetical protein